jgi:hypothetical protein
MSSSYRNQRRQGVVYGPVPPGGGGGAAVLGTLLGVLVVLVAMALLAVGAFALIGGFGPAQSPTPSQLAPLSPSPSALASGTAPPSTPSSSGSQPPSPSGSTGTQPTPSEATPTPTLPTPTFVPQVQEGPGFVTFGTQTDSSLHVTDARATFSSADPRVVWSAHLSSPANAADLHVEIYKLDATASNGRRLLWNTQPTVHATNAVLFVSHLRTHTALDGPGIYEVRYVRGHDVLADGFFEFTR